MSHVFHSIVLCFGLLAFASCSSTGGGGRSVGKVYPAAEIETVMVVSRTTDRVPATRGRVGGQVASVAGGLGGGIAGSILGGLVGPLMETAMIKKSVSNYTLRRSDGGSVTLIQDDDAEPLIPGQTAYLVTNGDGTSTVRAIRPVQYSKAVR